MLQIEIRITTDFVSETAHYKKQKMSTAPKDQRNPKTVNSEFYSWKIYSFKNESEIKTLSGKQKHIIYCHHIYLVRNLLKRPSGKRKISDKKKTTTTKKQIYPKLRTKCIFSCF